MRIFSRDWVRERTFLSTKMSVILISEAGTYLISYIKMPITIELSNFSNAYSLTKLHSSSRARFLVLVAVGLSTPAMLAKLVASSGNGVLVVLTRVDETTDPPPVV